jgi:hypothetical protein
LADSPPLYRFSLYTKEKNTQNFLTWAQVIGNVTEFYGTKLKELALQEIAVEMEDAKFEKDFALFLQQNAKGVKGGLKDRKLNGLSHHLRSVSLTASPKVYFFLSLFFLRLSLTKNSSCAQY